MKLTKLDFAEFKDSPQSWQLDNCTFEDINLIVGKNASGKTRLLNTIRSLALLLSKAPKLPFDDGNYDVTFENGNNTIFYSLHYSHKRINQEQLTVGTALFLQRESSGEGYLFAREIDKNLKFQTEPDEVAAFVRRDPYQHPFLEDLYNWAQGLRRYDFGTALGQYFFPSTVEKADKLAPDPSDPNQVIAIFLKGEQDHPSIFKKSILQDMKQVGFDLDDVWVQPTQGLLITPLTLNQPFNPLSLHVREHDLPAEISQLQMSQGMFRTLSVIVQLNYSQLSHLPSCILIDDIGEGLDFERSSALVQLLIDKAKTARVQLIMATNDRFIMNKVPFEYWIILQRDGPNLTTINYRNSKAVFDKFELTGLNNFDFFSSRYYLRSANRS